MTLLWGSYMLHRPYSISHSFVLLLQIRESFWHGAIHRSENADLLLVYSRVIIYDDRRTSYLPTSIAGLYFSFQASLRPQFKLSRKCTWFRCKNRHPIWWGLIQVDSCRMSFIQGIVLKCHADEKSLYEYESDFSYYRKYEVYNIWNWITINWSNQSYYWLKWYWMVHWKN